MSGRTPCHPLIAFAHTVIECAVQDGDPDSVSEPPEHAIGPHDEHGGVFVTLMRYERLRGCIGTLDPTLRFCAALRNSAVCAALHDSRFAPLVPAELVDLAVHISVLTPPRPMSGLDELVLGRHGIVVQAAERRGVFLPQVATNHGLDRVSFLSRCCTDKADLPPDAWRSGAARVLLFETVEYQ